MSVKRKRAISKKIKLNVWKDFIESRYKKESKIK